MVEQVRVTLRFFAIMRERIGESERQVSFAGGSRVADVVRYVEQEFAEIAPLFRASMVMRNHEYVDREEQLADGDEIAFIPPVSGGERDHFRVTADVLDSQAITARVEDDGAGALVTFAGTVRDNARGRGVLWLDYEAYAEAAELQLGRIGDEMRERWPILAIAIEHRTGRLAIGEASVLIAVSSPHRADAIEACHYAIDRLKATVPIWKKEVFEGGEEWLEGTPVGGGAPATAPSE